MMLALFTIILHNQCKYQQSEKGKCLFYYYEHSFYPQIANKCLEDPHGSTDLILRTPELKRWNVM